VKAALTSQVITALSCSIPLLAAADFVSEVLLGSPSYRALVLVTAIVILFSSLGDMLVSISVGLELMKAVFVAYVASALAYGTVTILLMTAGMGLMDYMLGWLSLGLTLILVLSMPIAWALKRGVPEGMGSPAP